jgi:hypothetical protein
MAVDSRQFATPNVLSFDPQLREAFLTLEDYLAGLAGGGGSGGDEVFIGPSDPGSAYELWYDTDAAGYESAGLAANRPASAPTGHTYYATDTDVYAMYDGTGWFVLSEGWKVWAPTLTGWPAHASNVFQYRREHQRCHVRARMMSTASPSISNPNFSLPFAPDSLYFAELDTFVGTLYDTTGARRQALGYVSGSALYIAYLAATAAYTTLAVISAASPFVWKANDYISLAVTYTMNSKYA